MNVSKQNTCTCAGCGRTFKTAIDTKIFKCASCQDLINTTDDSTRPQAGKIMCGNCWSAVQLRDQLWKTSEELFGETQPGAGNGERHEHTARFAELEAKLAVVSDARDIALRERDLALEVRQKLERTLADFLGKFATARQAELKAVKGADSAMELVRSLKGNVKDLETELAIAQETERDALTERNSFAEINVELEALVDELEARLTAQSPVTANPAPRLSSARMSAISMPADGKLNELQTKLTANQEELAKVRQQFEKDRTALRAEVADLHGELVAAQVENFSLLSERDVAVAASHETNGKLEDLAARLARAQEALAVATKESESSGRSLAREQEEAQKAKAELLVLRDAATAALEPMAGEINVAMKELTDEANKIRQQLADADAGKALEGLNERMTTVRRQLVGRISMVLGVPAAESQALPNIKLESIA